MKTLFKTFMLTVCILCFGSIDVDAVSMVPTVGRVAQCDAGNSTVDVEWDAVIADGRVMYDVQYAQNSNGPWAYVNSEHYSRTSPRAHMTGLSAAKRYYVRVRAYVKDGDNYVDGQWSAPIDVVTCHREANLKPIQTGCTADTITCTWTNSGADFYRVYWKGTDSTEMSIDVPSTLAVLTKLYNGMNYDVRVIPCMKSSTFTAFPKGYTPSTRMKTICDKPVCVIDNAYFNIGSIDVTANNYGTSNSDGFEYELLSYDNKSIVKGSYSGYKHVDISNKYFKKYQFFRARVRNFVSLNNGTRIFTPWSDWEWYGRNPDITKIKRSGNGLKLSWKKMKGVTNYTVYASTKEKSGFKKVVTTKKTSYVVRKIKNKKLSSKKRYYFYVVANKKVGKHIFKTETDRSFYLN